MCHKGKSHKTTILTLEKPGQIKSRLEYGLSVAHWIKKNTKEPIILNHGILLCVNEKLEIIDTIKVDELNYQKIN